MPLGCQGKSNGDLCAFGEEGELVGFLDEESAAICCSGACADVTQDPNNCGFCGVVCPSGICVTSGGGDDCFPAGPDENCLQSCGPMTLCSQGACVDSSCDDDAVFCAAEDGAVGMCCLGLPSAGVPLPVWCADLANDPANCGGCGFRCPAGQGCAQGVCSGTPPDCAHRIGGFCNLDAGPSYLCCPGVGCTNVDSDATNCGICGVVCPSSTACLNGSCR